MKQFIKKVMPILFTFSLVLIVLYFYRRDNNIKTEVRDKGVYVLARIKDKIAVRGGSRSFKYSFLINGDTVLFERYVDRSFYKSYIEGDTIIVQVLSSNVEYSIIREDLVYKHCFGNQPIKGWADLPNCN